MEKPAVAFIGNTIIGQHLALRVAEKKGQVALFNRKKEKTDAFIQETGKEDVFIPLYEIDQLSSMMYHPRTIFVVEEDLDVKAKTLDHIAVYLDRGDIIIDTTPSHPREIEKQSKNFSGKGLRFLGIGISGCIEDIDAGTAITAGGVKDAYDEVEELLQSIAATVDEVPCCAYLGPSAAGSFASMVEMAIEYAEIECLAEAYALMKGVLEYKSSDVHRVIADWYKSDLSCFLIEITRDIFAKIDRSTGLCMVDVILDTATHSNQGKWAVQVAFALDVPVPSIAASVSLRSLSLMKQERVDASALFIKPQGVFSSTEAKFIKNIYNALIATRIINIAQGITLLQRGSKAYGYNIDALACLKVWRGGTVIRSHLLSRITEVMEAHPDSKNIMVAEELREFLTKGTQGLRSIIRVGTNKAIAMPALTACLSYFDGYQTERLPTNLIQAQNDYFRGETYQRADEEGTFKTDWTK